MSFPEIGLTWKTEISEKYLDEFPRICQEDMSHFLPVNVGHRQGKHSNVRMEERVLLLNWKGTLCILAGEVNRHTF